MDKEIIYQIMNGYIDSNVKEFTKEIVIEDEFANGKECEQLYNQVYQAKLRLEKKLGEYDNKDVELIISYMSNISEILSMKIYDYGKIASVTNQ